MALRALLVLLLLATATAQRGLRPAEPPLPPEARPAFEAALAAADLAVESPPPWSPDARAWREALTAARAAVAAAPQHPAPLRLLLRVYALVGWWVRAVDTAEDLRAAVDAIADDAGADPWDDGAEPAPAGPSSRELLKTSYAELAFARYQAGALDAALAVYERWSSVFPDDAEALRWMGRVRLELGDPAGALPYWERLVELLPDDQAARFFVAEAQLGVAVGPEASGAFRQGMARYEEGDLEAAAARFEEARAAAPGFAEAHAWAARVALEAGRPVDAVERYRAALELRPDDPGLEYFLRVARTQRDHGVAAGRAFFVGLAAYEDGDLAGAAAGFDAAVTANDRFAEGWAWLGRVRQEQARYADAERAWARVLQLDPQDERARTFVNLAREQRAYAELSGAGDGIAAAFAAGVAAFERADLQEAAARFREVAAADADSALAWTWLGRVAYAARDYQAAVEAFGRALELMPDDEDLAWFAADAEARLIELLEDEEEEEDGP